MGETSFKIMLVLFNVIFLAFIAGIIIFIYQYQIKKKKHNQQLLRKDETHKKEILKAQMEIQTNTMNHIGQEIHDSVGQKLTLASLYIKQLPIDQLAQYTTSLQSINDLVDHSLEELRQISRSLAQSSIKNQSTVELLEQLSSRVNHLNKCEVKFECSSSIKIHSIAIKTVIYRITQEFIQNSIKHAKCSLITIKLIQDTDRTTLHLEDNGIGFDMDNVANGGIGISNFEERAKWIGATLHYNSEIDYGTRLIIEIPENEL